MSSSTDNADNKATRAADEEDDNSIEDITAKQLTLQIEDLSIKNKQSDTPTLSTNNADNTNNNYITCAACGKEGEEDSMNICNKCKMVHYCNSACKKKHKSKHKKKCERRVAELHDEALFKKPPPREECPICMLLLPIDMDEQSFKSCCGKLICNGCIHAMAIEETRKGKKDEELGMCPYCRTLRPSSDEEEIERIHKLMERSNANAYYQLAGYYDSGDYGLQQDWEKANELWLKAGELGCAEAYSRLGYSYEVGRGVEINKEKAKHYWELAAMMGEVQARHILGLLEGDAGNLERAMKHFMVAARAGDNESLDKVKQGFMEGYVTKDDFAGTLRAYHESQTEMKSEARDKAADFFARRAQPR